MRFLNFVKSLWNQAFLGNLISKQQEREAQDRGVCLEETALVTARRRLTCTHRKGGTITNLAAPLATISKQLLSGDSCQFAVIKHQLMNGDWFIRCMRCGTKWVRPIRKQYKTELDYLLAVKEYDDMVKCPTSGASSGSILVRFNRPMDEAKYREKMSLQN